MSGRKVRRWKLVAFSGDEKRTARRLDVATATDWAEQAMRDGLLLDDDKTPLPVDLVILVPEPAREERRR